MRHFLLALALLLLVGLTAQAQQMPAFTFGLKGGASLTSLTNRNLESSRYLWGFHAGLTGNYALTTNFSLQIEGLYSQKGVRDDSYVRGTSYAERLRLHYLDAPLLVRFRAAGAYFEVGPQLGLLLSAHNYVDSPTASTPDLVVTSDYHRVDLGLASGIGYQLASGLGLGLRTNVGLLNVPKNNYSGTAVRNNVFQFYLTYQFTH